MKFIPVAQAETMTTDQIEELLAQTEAEFIVFQTVESKTTQNQMKLFYEKYPAEFTSEDIFYFLANPVYTRFLRKQENKEPFLTEGEFQFIDDIKISITTYLERDPFLVLAENYSQIMLRRSMVLDKIHSLEQPVTFEQMMFDIFQTTDSIMKERILEVEVLPKAESFETLDLDAIFALYERWHRVQSTYSSIPLLNREFDINLLNYLINTRIGPAFQAEVEQGRTENARQILTRLLSELHKFEKVIVSELVSLGYYFVQIPIEYYGTVKDDQAFMKAYMEFSSFLFSQMHFNSRQYYLRYYRQATNALYKAVRAESEKPLQKCYDLYFAEK